MAENLHSILTGYKAKDLIDKKTELFKSTMYYQKSPSSPVILDANMSVRDAATVLADNHISSAPIVEEGKFM
jgi:predicted transcriptional regulator